MHDVYNTTKLNLKETLMSSLNKKKQGFSLIEIMVVVVILGILSAIIVPKLMSRPDDARIVKAKQDVLSIETSLNLYKLDNGFYPSTDQGLKALVKKPNTPPTPKHWHQYLANLPIDPWDTPYLYLNPGQHGEIDIFTYGAKGESEAEEQASMIGNWEKSSENSEE